MKKKWLFGLISLFLSLNPLAGQKETKAMKLRFKTSLDFQKWAVLDSFEFDKLNNWELSSAKTADEPAAGGGIKTYFKKIEPSLVFSQIKGGRFFFEEYAQNRSCLGVKVLFPELISASVFLIPKESYKVDGLCKKIGLWLLGRGKNVDFSIVVRDYMSRKYPLFVTKLDYLGWQYFEVTVPPHIPQNYDSFPQKELIEIAGFMATFHPGKFADELHRPVYIYMDQLEALLDQNVTAYPGMEIQDNW